MKPCIVGRYSEIALKGKNRYLFEDRLVSNVSDCLSRHGFEFSVSKLRGRIIIYADHSAVSHLSRVFGFSSLSPAFELEPDTKSITDFVISHVGSLLSSKNQTQIRTFRISSNRQDKRFPLSSMELDRDIGSLVAVSFGLSVDLKSPNLNIGIDIHRFAYVFTERISCVGGLPVGVSGTVACLIESPRDIVIGYLMLKRGCSLVVKSSIDCSLLSFYDYGSPFVLSSLPLESLVDSFGCQAVVVPWLIDGFKKGFCPSVPVLAPLVGFSDDDANVFFRRISDVSF